MIHVPFDPAQLTGEQKKWWENWTKRAEAERKKALKEKSSHKFKQKVWKDLKDWLLANVFYGKCAYCEGPIDAGFYGDGEHYRPKGEVTVDGLKIKVGRKAHPGYFWLAYHWKNLVPSCQKCNTGKGKQTQFPVGKTHINATLASRNDPEALDKLEKPLLLHPYFDQPEKYLVFGAHGVIEAKDENARGVATIKICDLKRGTLEKDRRIRQEEAWPRYCTHLGAQLPAKDFLAKEKEKPYYAALVAYLRIRADLMHRELNS